MSYIEIIHEIYIPDVINSVLWNSMDSDLMEYITDFFDNLDESSQRKVINNLREDYPEAFINTNRVESDLSL